MAESIGFARFPNSTRHCAWPPATVDTLLRLVAEYGVLFVFLNLLAQQFGVPLPGYPLLLVAGALAARGELSMPALLATGVAACLIADWSWYAMGFWAGRRVLRMLCRISLSPDGCVRQTESIFGRFGPPSLLVAKFVPGFASVATALAGAMRIRRTAFLFYDTLGASIWVGGGLALGWLFAPAIDEIVGVLARFGEGGLVLLALGITAYVGWKAWQRHRFNVQLRMARIPVETLAELVASGEPPLVVDVRSALAGDEVRIPGAVALALDPLTPAIAATPKDATIVTYCACPNDASAVLAARRLLELGWRDVRPLAGGIEAWEAAGQPIVAVEPRRRDAVARAAPDTAVQTAHLP